MTARFDIDDLDPEERRLRCAPDSWPACQPPGIDILDERFWRLKDQPAYEAVCAALTAQAARTARTAVRARARAYLFNPRQFAVFGEDLPTLPPRHLATALAYIARNPTHYRWFGNGGEIPAINLKAVRLCGRFLRAKAYQAGKAAE